MKTNCTSMSKLMVALLLLAFLLPGINLKAQVTIGSAEKPLEKAILDLKEYDSDGIATSTKGVILPRVALTDKTKLYPMYTAANYPTGAALDKLKQQYIGLTVINIKTDGDFKYGLHIWDGEEWKKTDDSPVIAPAIGNLLCGAVTMTPNKYEAGIYFQGLLKVPYEKGNGGAYDAEPSRSIGNGLTLTLIPGKLNMGGGEIMYNITGTPSAGSPTTTDFNINFLGKTCPDLIKVGSGVNTLGMRTLEKVSNIVTTRPADGNTSLADLVDFGTILIAETGSYAFNVRLYGTISHGNAGRFPFYIYLFRLPSGSSNKADEVMQDNAEIDLVTAANQPGVSEYSYSVPLGGGFQAGDKVIIRMYKPAGDATYGPSWKLKHGGDTENGPANPDSPIRTSLVFWKL